MCVCVCVWLHIVRVGDSISVYSVCIVLEEEVVVYLL